MKELIKIEPCPVCKQQPKLVWVGGNATKGTMQFKAICCSFEFAGAQDSLAYKAKQSAILNWNNCIVKM